MPEKSPAWVLFACLWTGLDYWTLPGELVSVLLRRDMSADSGLLCHAKTVEECKIVVSASWMDFIHCAYRHNSLKGEFTSLSLPPGGRCPRRGRMRNGDIFPHSVQSNQKVQLLKIVPFLRTASIIGICRRSSSDLAAARPPSPQGKALLR